jgi:hypothetical protein
MILKDSKNTETRYENTAESKKILKPNGELLPMHLPKF